MFGAIIIVTGQAGQPPFPTPAYHGVFSDKDAATAWATKNLEGYSWYWASINVLVDAQSKRIVMVG